MSTPVIEIFLDKQLSDITFEVEALDEWKSVVEELGLEKQLVLTNGKDSPIPYPWMNKSMENVYSTLCPAKVSYNKYDKTPIPLEVLKQIAFSVRDRHFQEIQIWYDDKSPDPLVVGLIGSWRALNKGYSYITDESGKTIEFASKKDAENHPKSEKEPSFIKESSYLIARWGDVKRDFSELKKMAVDRYVESKSNRIKSKISELTEKLSSIKLNSKAFMDGEISEYNVTDGI